MDLTLPFQLDATNKKFCAAFSQVKLLTRAMEEIQTRYERATKYSLHPHCTQLRLRLSVLEGVRAMFYEYAYIQAHSVDDLQRMVIEERRKREARREEGEVSRRTEQEERERRIVSQRMNLLHLHDSSTGTTQGEDEEESGM